MKKIILGLGFISVVGLCVTDASPSTAISFTGCNTFNTSSCVSFNASDVGQAFYVDWSDTSLSDPLRARAKFTITAFNSGSLTLQTRIKNTTWLQNLENAGLASMGFNFDPVSFTSGKATSLLLNQLDDINDVGEIDVFSNAELEANLPSIDNKIDVCAFAVRCTGGAQNKLLKAGNSGGFGGTGNNDLFDLTITGAFANTVALHTFGVKWQTSAGSVERLGTPRSPDEGPTAVPEPSTFLGSCLTVLGLVALTQKKRLFARLN